MSSKSPLNAFFYEAVLQFPEGGRSICMLCEKQIGQVVVAGHDKAAISIHCYLAVSHVPAMLQMIIYTWALIQYEDIFLPV